jgi:hypothetical protein
MTVIPRGAWRESPLLVIAALSDILASTIGSFLTAVSSWYLIPSIGLTLLLLALSLRGVRLAPYLMGGSSLVAAIGHAATLEIAHLPVVLSELVAVGLIAAQLMTHRRSLSRSE